MTTQAQAAGSVAASHPAPTPTGGRGPSPQMPYARWSSDPAEPLDDHSRSWLTSRIGPLVPCPATNPADIDLGGSGLPEAALADLTAVLGSDRVRTDRLARLGASAGSSYSDLLRQREGYDLHPPDAVVAPCSEAEVSDVLEVAERHQLAVLARGGGTSVVQGVEPTRSERCVLVLDLSALSGLYEINPVDRTARFGAGTTGPEAEALLAEHGLTIGHVPQSFERASLGGYAATRSSGQSSTGYGRFSDLVVALRTVTPRGVLVTGTGTPSAAGPDLRHVVIGSEGAFGVITEVTVRVRPRPDVTRYEGWVFPDLESGLTALRSLVQDGPRSDSAPDVCRLSDAPETEAQLGLIGGASEAVLKAYLRLRGREGGCLAILGWEGTKSSVRRRRSEALKTLTSSGAIRLGRRVGDAWHAHRFHAPYQRDSLMDAGVMVETLETATTWSRLPALRAEVRQALLNSLGSAGTPPLVLVHVSHCYSSGASLYFTVLARRAGRPGDTAAAIEQWQRAKQAATAAIVDAGGTITHHHAVGRAHLPWLVDEIGGLGMQILAATKSAVDPNHVLNPGVLIP